MFKLIEVPQIPDPLFIPGAIVFHYIKVG